MDGIVVGLHQWSAVTCRPLCRKLVFSLANGSPTRIVPTWFARILGIAAVTSDCSGLDSVIIELELVYVRYTF